MSKPFRNFSEIWEDRTPFDALKHQFGLKNNQLVKFIIHKNPISLTLRLISSLSYKMRRWTGLEQKEEIDAV